ncbi:MAG: indolepyruvate oxidoreductase subunit beta [Actinomycetia bacterium]|nr:indolepyruvate oxidoreductase subunit beta [Actinomycetes bacterium]
MKGNAGTGEDGPWGTRSVMLTGVGGHGTILAANLLARVLMGHGYDVKTSEVHGMAQRGGSVISMVRFGESVASPLIPRGEAEAVLATELLEALRTLDYLRAGGRMIVSGARVDPLTVLQGASVYPQGAAELLLRLSPDNVVVDAPGIAAEAGDARAANTVLLGILSVTLPVGCEEWVATMEEVVPPRALEANRNAFLAGREIASG